MGWPGMVEYSAAVQNQRASFLLPELKSARVVLNRLGLPRVCSGAFAIVYELEEGKSTWAIRCFTKEVGDLQERYAAIAEHLKKVRLSHFVSFDYVKDGIVVNGKPYPIMKMEWVEGVPLNRYVEQHLGDAGRLLALAQQFGELSADLERNKIGHGDLSADNVLVASDTIKLIDYDGMYVPKLAGRKARELGNAAFQHPGRGEALFGPEIDRFSVLLIGTALVALAVDPTLWQRHGGGNGLLFSPVDLRDPRGSSLFRALRAAREAALKGLADELAKWCESSPARLGKLPGLRGLKVRRAGVPAAAPAAPAAGAGVTVALTLAAPNGAGAPVATTVPAAAKAKAPRAARLAGWWARRKSRRQAAQAAAQAQPAPPPPPARQPAAAAPAPGAAARPAPRPAVPAAPHGAASRPVDWTGVAVTALGLGLLSVLFAPETGSLSVLALPAIMALVAWGDLAAQRAAPPGTPALAGSLFASGLGAGLFGVLFAPETGSLSLVALPVVLVSVLAGIRATGGGPPSAPTSPPGTAP